MQEQRSRLTGGSLAPGHSRRSLDGREDATNSNDHGTYKVFQSYARNQGVDNRDEAAHFVLDQDGAEPSGPPRSNTHLALRSNGYSFRFPSEVARSLEVSKPNARRSSGASAHPERVFVRVYDLSNSVLVRGFGMTRSYGAFHTGVEVYGREWSFGRTESEGSGITWCTPGEHPDHHFRETLAMGCTPLSSREVLHVIQQMKHEWTGRSYKLLTRNCHNFSDALCIRLGVPGLPSWVNDLAGAGAVTADAADAVYSGVSTVSTAAYSGVSYVALAAYDELINLTCCSSSSRKMTRDLHAPGHSGEGSTDDENFLPASDASGLPIKSHHEIGHYPHLSDAGGMPMARPHDDARVFPLPRVQRDSPRRIS